MTTTVRRTLTTDTTSKDTTSVRDIMMIIDALYAHTPIAQCSMTTPDPASPNTLTFKIVYGDGRVWTQSIIYGDARDSNPGMTFNVKDPFTLAEVVQQRDVRDAMMQLRPKIGFSTFDVRYSA